MDPEGQEPRELRQPLMSEISRQRKLALLLSYLSGRQRILEIGAGAGWFTRRLRSAGHDVVSLDIQGEADIIGDIRDWRALGLSPDSFDVVVALEVIEHIDCLDAITSLCRPDGLIFLSSPHPEWDWALQLMERAGLLQKRTSPHCNLVNFARLSLTVVKLKRPLWMHQVGLFRNSRMDEWSALDH